MKKTHFILSVFILALLAGCAVRDDTPSPGGDDTQTNDIEFRYYYHGFIIGPTDGPYPCPPSGTYIMGTPEEYQDFFSLYGLSPIYPLDTVDFDSECLIYSGWRNPPGIRGWSGKIQKICVSDTELNIIFDDAVNYKGERQEDAVAYQLIGPPYSTLREIYLLIVQKSDLPQTLFNQYDFSGLIP